MEISLSTPVNLKKAPIVADTAKEKKLRKACSDFEAIMLKQMLSAMRQSIPKDGLTDGGYAGEIYQSMADEEMAKSMAKGKGMGLGEMLYRQVSGQIQKRPQHGR